MAPPEEPNPPPAGNPAQAVRPKARPREYRDSEEFGTYLNHFERVATANGWSEPTKLVQLETVLKGKAQREFEMFIEESPDITWKDMTDKLKEELIPSVQKSLDQFAQLRMDDKSPKELYASLVKLSKLAHGDMNAEARHIIVRAQMLQALPKKLRHDAGKQEHLSNLDKDGLLELLTRIYDAEMKEESEISSYEPTINKVQTNTYKSPEARIQELEQDNSKLKQDINEVKDMLKELVNKKNRENPPNRNHFGNQRRDQTNTNRYNTQCYNCQGYGHFARDCYKPRVCSYCKKEGHSYNYCQQRAKNE